MKTYFKNSIISLLIHAVLITAIFFHFNSHSDYSVPGSTKIIQAYIPHNSSSNRALENPKSFAKASRTFENQAQVKNGKNGKNGKNDSQKTFPQSEQINGDQINHLVALIYQAISQHQEYPENADLPKNAKVIVSFVLNPNGDIQQAKITESSGNSSLDQAALLSVNESQPIQGVSEYLKSAQDFAIPIVYRAQVLH